MTNQEVYDIGRRLESFNYINQFDLDNVYIGYLIQIENTVYQVIVNQHNVIINPDEQAVIFRMVGSDSGKSLVNGVNSSFPFPDENREFIDDTDINIDPFELISKFDDNGDIIQDTSADKLNTNFTDFNRPW
jgi:hypothetical protein